MKDLLDTWASIYSNHAAIRTGIAFVHIGGLLIGGGSALAADVSVLASAHTQSFAAENEAGFLARTHRLVVIGLVAIFISGLLLLTADFDTYWHSRIYWLKMGLVGLLLANGTRFVIAERRARIGHPLDWTPLRNAARVSLSLWFLTTLAGAALPNIG